MSPRRGEAWEYVGPSYDQGVMVGLEGRLIVLILEERAFHQPVLVLHMDAPDAHGWKTGSTGTRWTVGLMYNWRRIA